jgi:sugar lactone lactonase YvrE
MRVGAGSAGRAFSFRGFNASEPVKARARAARLAALAAVMFGLVGALGVAGAQGSLLSAFGSFGGPGSAAGQLQSPTGMASDQDGNVYVADSGNNRVVKFSATGRFIAAWGWGVADGQAQSEVCTSNCQAGIAGSGPGQLSNPASVATGTDSVYVGDTGNNRVERFDTDGNFLDTIDGSDATQGAFQSVAGVTVDQDGNLWVSDSASGNVLEFDATGAFVQQWHDPNGPPGAIAVDSDNEAVYLAEGLGSVVDRYSLTGDWQGEVDRPLFFGSEGFSGPTPSALSLDPGTGNLYVGHQGVRAYVSVYNPDGVQVDDIGLGSATSSQGLTFSSQQLYVSDASTNRVTNFVPTPGASARGSDPDATVSGGGSTTAQFSALTNCGETAATRPFIVRWTQGTTTHTFRLTGVDSSTCENDGTSNVNEGSGTGTVDGSGSATVQWHFADNPDAVTIEVTPQSGNSLSIDASPPGPLSGSPGGVWTRPTTWAPLVTSESVDQTGKTTATLHAGIVPLGSDTSCHFEYVGNADFQASGFDSATSVPCEPASLGSGFSYQAASADLTGLTLGAYYHYRVVAANSVGTTTGAHQEFQAGPGAWAPHSRCPVDDPAMLSSDGTNDSPVCLASNSTHGSIKIGNFAPLATGNVNLQTGLVLHQSSAEFTVIAPPEGALIADPVVIPSTPLGPVTAVTESAGTPSDFDLFAGIQTGTPIITLPMKIHLENDTLGPSCYIGSNQDPIVLHPENTDLSNAISVGGFFQFDPSGVPDPTGPLTALQITNGVQGDDTFTVPEASGCGPNGDGSLNGLVNTLAGLPSPSGNNHLVLDDASSALVLPINGGVSGQQFSDYWHVGFD